MLLMLNMSPSMTSFFKKLIKYANKNQMSSDVFLISQQVLLLCYWILPLRLQQEDSHMVGESVN